MYQSPRLARISLQNSSIISLPRSSVALSNPYVIFFQPSQKDLPPNRPIEALVQSLSARDSPNNRPSRSLARQPWRGNVLVAKYADVPFGEMISCGMNDLPIISRHFQFREPAGNELDVCTLAVSLHIFPMHIRPNCGSRRSDPPPGGRSHVYIVSEHRASRKRHYSHQRVRRGTVRKP